MLTVDIIHPFRDSATVFSSPILMISMQENRVAPTNCWKGLRISDACHEKTDLKVFVIVIPNVDGRAWPRPSFFCTTKTLKSIWHFLKLDFSTLGERNCFIFSQVVPERTRHPLVPKPRKCHIPFKICFLMTHLKYTSEAPMQLSVWFTTVINLVPCHWWPFMALCLFNCPQPLAYCFITTNKRHFDRGHVGQLAVYNYGFLKSNHLCLLAAKHRLGNPVLHAYTVLTESKFPPQNRQNTLFLFNAGQICFAPVYYFRICLILGKF